MLSGKMNLLQRCAPAAFLARRSMYLLRANVFTCAMLHSPWTWSQEKKFICSEIFTLLCLRKCSLLLYWPRNPSFHSFLSFSPWWRIGCLNIFICFLITYWLFCERLNWGEYFSIPKACLFIFFYFHFPICNNEVKNIKNQYI